MPSKAVKKPQKLTPKRKAPSSHEWTTAFLGALRNSGNIRASCAAAGISREAAYKHRESDAAFADRWKDAQEDAIEALEAAARSRAMSASDTLLIFLLKAHRPDVYRENIKQDVTLNGKLTFVPIVPPGSS